MSLFRQPTRTGITFARKRGPFGPAKALWSYTAPNKKDFFSWFISGAQRLPNGNTLINSGATGIVFEVTPEKETVWKFANPFKNMGGPPRGGGAPPAKAAGAGPDGKAGGRPGGPPAGGPGGPPPGGPRRGNTLFRATRYALDHPAFNGKTLKPGKTLVEIGQELENPQPGKETDSARPKTAAASK